MDDINENQKNYLTHNFVHDYSVIYGLAKCKYCNQSILETQLNFYFQYNVAVIEKCISEDEKIIKDIIE